MIPSSSNKRPNPSERGEEIPSPGSSKRRKTKRNGNGQSPSPADKESLERAAAFFGKPLQQLLDENRQGSSYTTTSFPSTPQGQSPYSIYSGGSPASFQVWSPAAQIIQHGETHDNASSALVGTTGSRVTSELDSFQFNADFDPASGNGSWEVNPRFEAFQSLPSYQQMNVGEQPILGMARSDWVLPGSILTAPIESLANANMQSGGSPDHASDSSNLLGTPPWEDVQIPSVAAMDTHVRFNDANALWIDDSHKHIEADTQTPSVTGTPGRSTRDVRSPKSPAHGNGTKHQGRRAFSDAALREETSVTRKLKACVRCKMQKIRCSVDDDDPAGPCKTCQAISKHRVYNLPCMRYKLTECILYRIGKAPGLEFTFRWPVMKLKDITDWADNKIRTIEILSDVCPVPFKVNVRQFVPLPQDSRKRGWMDGRTKKFKETTNFAIVHMSNAVKDMQAYIDSNIIPSIEFFLKGADPLIKETYDFAIKHLKRHEEDEQGRLLGNYMRLWFAIRRTHTTEHIVSEDKLDMEPELKDTSFPLFGKVPLPPVMIQQLDMVLTLGVLNPLRKSVLEDFQNIILLNKPTSWLTIYLITFMSLHSCAVLSHENYINARKHGLKRRYVMPNFIQQRHDAANVFLAYYHYRTQPCNPFTVDWRIRHTTPHAEMRPREIQFLMRTKEILESKKDQCVNAAKWNLYEDELYFIFQMFEDNWQPRDSVIDFNGGTIENVPLRELA